MAKLLSNTRVYGTATVDTRLFVNGTTAVHSTNSGALQVGGGIGVAGGGFFAGTVTATNFVGSVSGASASLNGGTAGQIPYQVSPGVTSFFGPGAVGELLVGNGTSIPLFASTTTIYVGNAVTATNVRGGSANQFIYQTAPGVTAFINTGSMYVGNAVTATNVRGGNTGEFIYQSAPGVTAFINTSSMYVGRAAVADTVTGGGSTVQTAAQVGNAAYYLTFVDSNNAVATAELVYTTSSFVVNASTGNVGLGTTSPSEKLELSGAADAARIKLTNSALGRSSILGHGSNGFYWQPTNNGDLFELRDSAATGHVAFNPNTTNFGIGTTGPTTKLHIAGAAAETKVRVSANDGTNYRGFEVFAGATQKGGMYYRTTEGNVLQIWGPNTGIGAIYIDSNNVVDINSNSSVHSTATGALQVIGGLGVGGGGFFGGTVTATNFVGAFTGAAGQIETRQATANSSHFLTFVDSNNVSATAEIVYTTSSVTVNPGTGFVGIGTASPSYRLQIDTTSEWGVVQRYANDTTTNRGTVYLGLRGRGSLGSPTVPTSGTILAGLAGGGWNGSAYTLGWNGGAEILLQASETWTGSAAGSEILFRTTPLGSATPQNRMFIAENGRVGIGTTSPTNNLTVSGSSNQSIRIYALDGGGSAELDLLSNGAQHAFIDFGPNDLRFRSTNADMSVINNQSVLVLANGGSVIAGGTSAFTTGGTAKLTIVDSSVALSVGASNSDLMYVRRLSGGNYQFQTSTSSPGDNTGNIHIQPYGGNVGIGTTAPPNKLSVNSTSAPLGSAVQISHPGGDWGLIIKRNIDDAGNSNFSFLKSRGEAGNQIVQGDSIGRIAWHAVTNTTGPAIQQLAEIGVTNSVFSANDADAYMFFSTKAAGGSLTERVRITPAGDVGIGTSSPTNQFGARLVHIRTTTAGQAAVLQISPGSGDTNSMIQLTGDDGSSGSGVLQMRFRNQYKDAIISVSGNPGSATTPSLIINTGNAFPAMTMAYGGNIGIANSSPQFKLDVTGTARATADFRAPIFYDTDNTNFYLDPASTSILNGLTVSGNKTFARFNSAYIFARGTGLNNNANRYVAVNGTEISNNSNRGLTLTIINAATLAVESSTNYDTYGVDADSTALATAITGMTSAQIGILTSYDAWELAVNDALRNAARKVGLSKLANYSAGGSRRPYAAIFYGTSDDPNASTKDAIERMESDDADAPRALITTYITSDGAQAAIDGAYSVNALYSSNSTIEDPVVIVNSSGFVGIGTNSPDEELVVSGSSYPVVKIVGSQQPSLYLDSGGGDVEIYNSYGTYGMLYMGFSPSNSSQLFYFDGYGKTYANSKLELLDSKLVITGGGNVGIGTTSPGSKLQVVASTPTGIGGLPSGVTGTFDSSTNNYLLFRNTADNNTYSGIAMQDNNIGGFVVFGNAGGAGDLMYVAGYNGGQLLWGTTDSISPAARTVTASWNSTGLQVNSGDMRASSYLDINNTAFFVDPAGTSNVNTFNGFSVNANIATGRGSYGAATVNLILNSSAASGAGVCGIDFRSGGNYPSDGAQIYYTSDSSGTAGLEASRLWIRVENDGSGSVVDDIYMRAGRIFYDATTVDGTPSDPGHIFRRGGSDRLFVYSDNTTAVGSFRAPIFYDSDNTSYYFDGASTSQFYQARFVQRIAIGNGTVPFLNTGTAGIWFSNGGGSNHFVGSHDSDNSWWGIYTNAAWRAYLNGSGHWVVSGDVRTPIFYDLENTAYYLDPAGIGNDALRVRGGSLFGPNISWGAYLYVGTNGRVGSSATVAVTNGNLHIDCQDGYGLYFNWYSTNNIYSRGNFGVGSDTASYRLHVHGDGYATGVFIAASDEKLKENVVKIDNAIDKVMAIRGVTYTRNDLEDKEKRHAGVIAQEVEKVLPEVISEDDNGIKAVAYGNMAGLFVEAIKELKKELDESKELILSLKKEIAELKKDN